MCTSRSFCILSLTNKGAQAWDIRLRVVYAIQTCMEDDLKSTQKILIILVREDIWEF
jgi:hypothetical protein